MTDTMTAISVTFCRDRGPKSQVAPLAPLPPELWEQFRAGVAAALEAIPARETEHREGHTIWDGRPEWCLTISRLWATPTPEQMAALQARLAELAALGDQVAVVLHEERRHLILAA